MTDPTLLHRPHTFHEKNDRHLYCSCSLLSVANTLDGRRCPGHLIDNNAEHRERARDWTKSMGRQARSLPLIADRGGPST